MAAGGTLPPIRIGALVIDPPLVQAPLADLTHAAFRELVAELGGCGLFYTEMLNSRVVAAGDPARDPYLARGPRARPLVAQLVGGDPATMARAAARLADLGFDGIDINMGCSRSRFVRYGWGLGLMADEERALAVVDAVRRAVPLPLLVKLRSGLDHDPHRLLAFCRRLAAAGVDGVCLHPRSGADGFKRPARWAEIGHLVRELPLPVIGNGDVFTADDHRRLVAATGCHGVMIGRGGLVRPWLFAEIASGRPWPGEPAAVLRRYGELLQQYLPAPVQAERFTGFCNWFGRNYLFHRQLMRDLHRLPDLASRLEHALAFVTANADATVRRPLAARL